MLKILGLLFLGVLILVLGIGALTLIASGFGIPVLVFPVAWYFMYRNYKKDRERKFEYLKNRMEGWDDNEFRDISR